MDFLLNKKKREGKQNGMAIFIKENFAWFRRRNKGKLFKNEDEFINNLDHYVKNI